MKKTSVHEWHKCFHDSCVSVDDYVHSGCLSTITNDEIIEGFDKLFEVTKENPLSAINWKIGGKI